MYAIPIVLIIIYLSGAVYFIYDTFKDIYYTDDENKQLKGTF